MKTITPLVIGRLVLFAFAHSAIGADASAPAMSEYPQYPWFGVHPLPSANEKKVLESAREAAEKNPEVADAIKAYTAKWVTADDSIRILMLKNPLSKPFLEGIILSQMIHEKGWMAYSNYNDRDILLPNANWDPISDSIGIMVSISNSPTQNSPRATPPPDSMEDIRQAALNDKGIQQQMQSVRDAYQKLDKAVRAAMQQNPETKVLMAKYDYLLYGRQDLGFIACSYVGSIVSSN